MKNERKIVLPIYKIAYAVSFAVILSLVRGVTHTYEVGLVIEPPFAILAAVFCADTYVQEIMSRRSEIHRLYPVRKRTVSILERLLIQDIFLLLLAGVCYGLFFLFQTPKTHPVTENEWMQFGVYAGAIAVTVFFWSVLANTLSMIFRSMWMGIGGCFLLWLASNSQSGEKLFGAWNVFSYTFREVENAADLTWLCGKALCLFVGILLLLLLPKQAQRI